MKNHKRLWARFMTPSFPGSRNRWSDIYSGGGKVLLYGIKSLLSWWCFTSQMANRSWCDWSRNYFKSGLRNLVGRELFLIVWQVHLSWLSWLHPSPCMLANVTGHINETKSSECQEYAMPPFCICLTNDFWAWNKDPWTFSTYIFFFPTRHLFRKYLHIPASSRPIGKVSLDCVWVTASLLPRSALV